MSRPPVVIAHDYLTQRGGAEKVVLALAKGFPGAPIQTTLYEAAGTYPEFRDLDIRTTQLNRFGFLRRNHRFALPFLARSVSRTVIDADLTVVSSSGWAHGFRTTGKKVVYCYSPARWLYQQDVYLGDSASLAQRLLIGVLGPWLRRWDRRQARSADAYIAISTVVQQRIRDTYGIDATVVHAPHSYDASGEQSRPSAIDDDDAFYICISRLLPYKNVDAVVDAFRELDHRLVVVGAGPEEERLRSRASANVTFLKGLTDSEMRWLYAHCEAVVAASYEDFGLTPIEAGVFGKPAIALRWGGFLDTISEGTTGTYFDAPLPEAIGEAILASRTRSWDPEAIRRHAATFSEENFLENLRIAIDRAMGAEATGGSRSADHGVAR